MDILQQLIGAVRDGNFLLVIVIVAVPLIFNFQKIVEFSEERKKARIVKLSEALNSPLITGLTKFHLEEELVTEQFKITTGIRLEKEIREAVIQAHINTKGELDFKHFKRALPHIFYKDLKLGVKISFFELASFWVNLIFGFILVLVGLLVMELPSQIKGISIAQGLGIFGMGALFIAIALFMISQTIPVVSARKVSKELEKTHNNLIFPTAKASVD